MPNIRTVGTFVGGGPDSDVGKVETPEWILLLFLLLPFPASSIWIM